MIDPTRLPPPPWSARSGREPELSRRELLRAGLVLPALALPFAVSCRPSRDAASHRGPSNPAPTGIPETTTVVPRGPRGPRGNGQTVTFAFGGDTHFTDQWDTEGGAVYTGVPVLADQVKADPTKVLAPVAPILSGADLAMVNLETAITERGEPVAGKSFHFRSPAASFVALKAAGVDVVNMANNHALDYGPVGMQDTFDAIASSKFPVVGIGRNASEAYRPYRTVIKGQRIAIFGALDWLEPALIPLWSATETQPGIAFSIDRTRLLAAVAAVRPDVDTLVAFLHWGIEETHCSSPEQQGLTHALLAAGADIVVGSHAHRVFGAGHVGTSLVAYGLGNFVYWREDGESGRSGVLLVEATGREVDSYSWVPARIKHGVAVPQVGSAAAVDLAEWEHRRSCSGIPK
ncbi:MAG: CapA family protein [Actinomycetota bacterium]|nr:CapA family protein [Actinomycetota bacterium]MDQ6910629.1 CapA family protein [Actinomycetota bacterium]MDQ6946900.1 CapA family protein [Actinomycetota bacterium]